MAAPLPPRIVWFRVADDADLDFAIRRCDGQLWACNRWRGYRLCGIQSRRFRPQLVAGDTRIPVEVIRTEGGTDAAA